VTTPDADLISRTSARLGVAGPNSVSALLQNASALVRGVDRVVLSLVALMVVLATLDAQLARRTLGYVASELVHLGPWFALSVLFAAAAKATGGDAIVARAFAGREGRMIPLAAIVGGLTPFCSCGVIPLVAGLFGAGVPLAPIMAFWIASPLMDPTQFFVIAGTLGVGFAIAKTAAAIGMGLFGGYGTMLLTRSGLLSTGDELRITVERKSCCKSAKQDSAAKPVWRFWEEAERAQIFLTASAATAWFLIRWLTLAFVIESLMTSARGDRAMARHGPIRYSDRGADRGTGQHQRSCRRAFRRGPYPDRHEPGCGSRLHARDHSDGFRCNDCRVGAGAPKGLRTLSRLRGARIVIGWLRLRVGTRLDLRSDINGRRIS
jgi:uncharacterized membrane protein YraQ (UPF0718 family)